MKKLGNFKNSLLMSAVVLSLFSSPANAVSEEVVQAYWRLNSSVGDNLNPENLNNLVKLDEVQWEQFKEISQFFMTEYIYISDRAKVIAALAKVDPVKLFHGKFFPTLRELTNYMGWPSQSKVITHFSKVDPEKWGEFVTTVQSLTNGLNGNKGSGTRVASGIWDKFIIIAGSVVPLNTGKYLTSALGKVAAGISDDLASILTEGMNGYERAKVIVGLANVAPGKWPQFVTTAHSLITPDSVTYFAPK